LLAETGQYLSGIFKRCRLCIVSDETVYGLYGEAVSASLKSAGYDVFPFTFPPGENSKTMDTVCRLLEFLAKERFTRADAIIALGGGVPGDLAGFAASCYLRGISFAQIPTTLLSAVDSSVGGKTGVNLSSGKNLAGAFLQPSFVLCDCGILRTLPAGLLKDGVAEIIKYCVIADCDLFELMCRNSIDSLCNDNFLEHIVEKCVIIKSGIVAADEHDTGKRRLLNFGHTIGHAVEKLSGYEASHGEAVAFGMLFISRAAEELGITRARSSEEIERVLKQYDFSLSYRYPADELYEAALIDKKRYGDSITLIIPEKIGDARSVEIDIKKFKELVVRGSLQWMSE